MSTSAPQTYAERQKNAAQYGTRRVHFGGAATKPFDHCVLCQAVAREPQVCQKGHLFCRSCAVAHLLAQKKDIRRQREAYDAEVARQEREAERAQAAAGAAERAAFARMESSVTTAAVAVGAGAASSTALVVRDADAAAAGGADEATGADAARAVEAAALSSRAPVLHTAAERAALYRESSPWIASAAPSVAPRVAAPPAGTSCPEGGHPLKLKHLVAAVFTPLPDDAALRTAGVGQRSDQPRYQCPACNKALTHQPVSLLRRCGHVVCTSCVRQFVKPDKMCLVCGKPCRDTEAVPMQQGGTGFAAHNRTVSEVHTPQGL